MPNRIPESIIQSVKANTPFLSLLKSYGIKTSKKGNSYMAVCPFHNDSQASLSIDRKQNLFHCLGCDAAGNVIQFVERLENISFPKAVDRLLALKGNPRIASIDAAISSEKEKEEEKPVELSAEERNAILLHIVNLSVEDLRNSEPGRTYLEKRGLEPLRLLESYTLGFHSGNSFDKLADTERAKLEAVGLIRDGRSLFDGCIMFPLVKDGRITTIYGRKAVSGTGSHYLLPCKREGLYLPTAGLNPQKPVVITESIIDGLSLFAAGITNVLPLLGVNGFLPDHLAYLKEQSFPKIFIALNGDDAGNRAAAALKQNLAGNNLTAQIIELPAGEDINDMLRELGGEQLKQWFIGKVQTDKPAGPTVWEDDFGGIYALFDDREYRIQGLALYGMDKLRVNLKVCRIAAKETFHIDTLDLYNARGRELFANQASGTLEVDRERIARDLTGLINLLEELRLKKKEQGSRKTYEMSEEERREALEYLKTPNLLERIAADFEACGMVGNKDVNVLAYLGALSRMTERPFGTLIVSRSGAGKSFLQDMVASFTPEESLLRMTRLTGQSLFYQGKDGLKHKLLTIEEDEGMQEAMYSIRTLLSSQKLCLHGLKTDAKTGEFKAYENMVEGPAAVMISTTDLSAFDHESANRFFVLYLDESREQTRAILEHQRKNSGPEKIRLRLAREKIGTLHRNIQRLLKPIAVSNRLGTGVEYPAEILNTRREQTKTEALIETVALLHQYQREVKESRFFGVNTRFIEVLPEDVEAVHAIAGELLRQSLDELSKLCRELLYHIHELVNERYQEAAAVQPGVERWQVTFTRKELKDRCGWSRWHLEEHLKELEEGGYIARRTGRKGQKYAYCLVEEVIPDTPNIKWINGKKSKLAELAGTCGKTCG